MIMQKLLNRFYTEPIGKVAHVPQKKSVVHCGEISLDRWGKQVCGM